MSRCPFSKCREFLDNRDVLFQSVETFLTCQDKLFEMLISRVSIKTTLRQIETPKLTYVLDISAEIFKKMRLNYETLKPLNQAILSQFWKLLPLHTFEIRNCLNVKTHCANHTLNKKFSEQLFLIVPILNTNGTESK